MLFVVSKDSAPQQEGFLRAWCADLKTVRPLGALGERTGGQTRGLNNC